MTDTGQEYVPAINNDTGAEGKLAVVTAINILNGTYTSGTTYVPGSAEYGQVAEGTENQLRQVVIGTWRHLKKTQPEIYEKYFAEFEPDIFV